MDTKKSIELAGGAKHIATACVNRKMVISAAQIQTWKRRNQFPSSEWTGETSVAGVICELIKAAGCAEQPEPIELCPGAGQYTHTQSE